MPGTNTVWVLLLGCNVTQLEQKEIFGYSYPFDSLVGPANRAIDFFVAQCAAARKAVDMWCLMAVRINSKVNKDIRKKIGMLIWEAREQADYVIEEEFADVQETLTRARVDVE